MLKGDFTSKDKKDKPSLIEEQKHEQLAGPEKSKKLEHEQDPALLEKPEDQRLAELEDKLLRLQAEFENFRKRTAKEHDLLRQNAGAELVLNLLEVVDEFSIALEHIEKAKQQEFKEGIRSIHDKLVNVLRKDGLEQMPAQENFDPYKHDAIGFEKGKDGTILKTVSNGYLYKGRILRHAKVIVGKKEEKN